MTKYIKSSIEKYLADLAAKKPAPGGGSASALAAVTGIALVSMVCNFTLGKKKYKDFETVIGKILSRAESLRKELLNLIDEDVEAYKRFMASKKDEKALKETLSVPLKICKLTHEGMKICPELVEKGNAFLISDVGCAAELLEGAFCSALFNVEINLSGVNDKDFIIEIKKIIEPMKKEVAAIRDAVAENVNRKMG